MKCVESHQKVNPGRGTMKGVPRPCLYISTRLSPSQRCSNHSHSRRSSEPQLAPLKWRGGEQPCAELSPLQQRLINGTVCPRCLPYFFLLEPAQIAGPWLPPHFLHCLEDQKAGGMGGQERAPFWPFLSHTYPSLCPTINLPSCQHY